MHVSIYLNYAGSCEEAFRFYEQHLGGKLMMIVRHGDGADARFGAGWASKVLHAQLQLGDGMLMGADVPTAEPMRSAYVTLEVDGAQEAERVYRLLTEGGQVFMPLERTFYADHFAMFRDRFGTSWMLLQGMRAGDPPRAA